MKLHDITNLDKDDLLKAVGLQAHRSTAWMAIPGVALFGLGILVGAGVGMLFAPKSGRELRDDISDRVSDLRMRASKGISEENTPSQFKTSNV